jgi:hypothetical protein
MKVSVLRVKFQGICIEGQVSGGLCWESNFKGSCVESPVLTGLCWESSFNGSVLRVKFQQVCVESQVSTGLCLESSFNRSVLERQVSRGLWWVKFKGKLTDCCCFFLQTILFTTDEEILEAVSQYDEQFDGDVFSDDSDEGEMERPKTADEGSGVSWYSVYDYVMHNRRSQIVPCDHPTIPHIGHLIMPPLPKLYWIMPPFVTISRCRMT